MKKILATLGAALMMLGLFGAASAQAAPGPDADGPAKKGLCTAYFNGSDTGRANKRGAPPFQNLEAAAELAEMTVEAFCGVVRDDEDNVTDDGLVGGNPDYDDPGAGNNNRGGSQPEA
ncbi:MAG TPA: hypothetical protein VFV42_00405 [Acidimicrobiales bacterium]|nr:hypothetical protein [Acidimicrobiales bacterium]